MCKSPHMNDHAAKPVNFCPRFGDLMSSETSARSLCRRMVCPVVKLLGHPCSLGRLKQWE